MVTYSYSKLNSIWGCPYAFYLNYIKKDKDKIGNGFSDCGLFVHSIMEKYLSKKISKEDLIPYFEKNWDNNVANGVILYTNNSTINLTKKYYNQCHEFLENIDTLSNYLGFNVEVIDVEKKFFQDIKIDGKTVNINGIIDLIVKDENGNYLVLDWKSKDDFKDDTELNEYARQLYMYSHYIEETYGVLPIKIGFLQFRSNKQVIIDFNIDNYHYTDEWILKSIDKINNSFLWEKQTLGLYEKTPKEQDNIIFFCNNLCSYRHTCDKDKGLITQKAIDKQDNNIQSFEQMGGDIASQSLANILIKKKDLEKQEKQARTILENIFDKCQLDKITNDYLTISKRKPVLSYSLKNNEVHELPQDIQDVVLTPHTTEKIDLVKLKNEYPDIYAACNSYETVYDVDYKLFKKEYPEQFDNNVETKVTRKGGVTIKVK